MTKTSLALPFLLLLSGFARDAKPQAPPLIDTQAASPYRIAVNVDLVVLHATVRDRQGRVQHGITHLGDDVCHPLMGDWGEGAACGHQRTPSGPGEDV